MGQGTDLDERLRGILGELRHRFERLYGERLVEMVLYGSRARGDGDPCSDTDVLVVLRGPVRPGDEIERTGEIVADISLRFGEVITCVFMDQERFAHRNGPFLRNVRKEGVAL